VVCGGVSDLSESEKEKDGDGGGDMIGE